MKRLQVCLTHPAPALLRYGVPSQIRQASRHPALRDETVAGQRCQISGYEHLEDVTVNESNRIPLTDSSRSWGLRRGGEGEGPREETANAKGKATECQRGVKVAGMRPKDINRLAAKEVALSFIPSPPHSPSFTEDWRVIKLFHSHTRPGEIRAETLMR